jgi:hypothetical protein
MSEKRGRFEREALTNLLFPVLIIALALLVAVIVPAIVHRRENVPQAAISERTPSANQRNDGRSSN